GFGQMHGHRSRCIRVLCATELAMVITAPCEHLAVGSERQRVRSTCGDRAQRYFEVQWLWRRYRLQVSEAELPRSVAAPRVGKALARQRQHVTLADAQIGKRFVDLNLAGCGVDRRRDAPQRAVEIQAPGEERAVAIDRAEQEFVRANDARVTHPRYGLWCGQRYRLSLSADPGGIGAPDDDVARFGDAETHAESGGDRRERLLE